MHSDFKELLSTLNARRVKYLVVGAYAVSIYVQPRATKDLDFLVKAVQENLFLSVMTIDENLRRHRHAPRSDGSRPTRYLTARPAHARVRTETLLTWRRAHDA